MANVILYAEDDPNDIALVQISFQSRPNVELHFVRDGMEAIDYLAGRGQFGDRRAHPFPDLMLLDIKMPRLSGFDVLGWLRQQPAMKDLPVVIVTSSDQQADINKAYALGANAYVVKPSAWDRLQSVLTGTADFFLWHALKPGGHPPETPPPSTSAQEN